MIEYGVVWIQSLGFGFWVWQTTQQHNGSRYQMHRTLLTPLGIRGRPHRRILLNNHRSITTTSSTTTFMSSMAMMGRSRPFSSTVLEHKCESGSECGSESGSGQDIAVTHGDHPSAVPDGVTLVSDYIGAADCEAISREVRGLLQYIQRGSGSGNSGGDGLNMSRILVRRSAEFGRTICNVFGDNLLLLGDRNRGGAGAGGADDDNSSSSSSNNSNSGSDSGNDNKWEEHLDSDSLPHLHTLYRHMVRVGEQFFQDQPLPNALQINVYEPHGGCPLHVDAKSLGPRIAMLSFESSAVMSLCPDPGPDVVDQTEVEALPDHVQLLLRPGSLLLLEGDARYEWLHGVRGGTDTQTFGTGEDKQEIQKGHRISVVFWNMRL